jgi:hypothetical protein
VTIILILALAYSATGNGFVPTTPAVFVSRIPATPGDGGTPAANSPRKTNAIGVMYDRTSYALTIGIEMLAYVIGIM